MRRSLFALVLALAGAMPAGGACIERRLIPNLPPVTTFNSNSALRARAGVTADFDGDGVTDVAVIGPVGAIVYGTAAGLGFARTLTWTTTIEPTQIVTADFNGDGRPDVAMSDTSTIVVRLARSDGTFGPEQVIHHAPDSDDSISGLATGDFDGDGRQDLLVAGAKFVTTYRGRGDGTFTRTAALSAPGFRHDMAVADFNHDGRLDVAAASYADSTVVILRGNGDGTFTISQQASFAFDPKLEVHLVAADFDGDLQTDLAVAVGAGIQLMLGNGDATFHTGPLLPLDWTQTAGAPQRLVAADFDRDSFPDLLVAGSFRLARFWNLGGHFDTPDLFAVSGQNIPTVIKSVPIDAFLIDVDSDHWLDVVELDSLGFVAVLLNGCGGGLFVRSSADSIVDGDPITITLLGIDGPETSPTDFFDNGVPLGSGNGTLTVSLHGAGTHPLSARSGPRMSASVPVTVHDHLSTIGVITPADHSVYGEGVRVAGGVSTDTGELPHFGNVEVLDGSTVLAVAPVVNGAFDILVKPDAGNYDLTARYAGAGPWPRSGVSSSFRHAVSLSPTTLSIATTASSICNLKFPPILNGTWTVTVSATTPFASPVGSVTLSIPQLSITQSASLIDGRAAFTFNRVPVGTYAVTATYAGGGNFTPSQSSGTFDIPRCRHRIAGH